MQFLYFVLAGLLGGVLGGMGMGGGTILIPILTIFLNVSQHVAQSVNLVSFIPMALIVLIVHLKNKLIEKKGILYIIIPAIITSILASVISNKIDGVLLSKIFGGFLIALSIFQFVIIKKAK